MRARGVLEAGLRHHARGGGIARSWVERHEIGAGPGPGHRPAAEPAARSRGSCRSRGSGVGERRVEEPVHLVHPAAAARSGESAAGDAAQELRWRQPRCRSPNSLAMVKDGARPAANASCSTQARELGIGAAGSFEAPPPAASGCAPRCPRASTRRRTRRVQQPGGRREDVVEQEPHGAAGPPRGATAAWMGARLVRDLFARGRCIAADHHRMPCRTSRAPIALSHAAAHVAQELVVVELVGRRGGREHHRHDALEVRDAEAARPHRVVTRSPRAGSAWPMPSMPPEAVPRIELSRSLRERVEDPPARRPACRRRRHGRR